MILCRLRWHQEMRGRRETKDDWLPGQLRLSALPGIRDVITWSEPVSRIKRAVIVEARSFDADVPDDEDQVILYVWDGFAGPA